MKKLSVIKGIECQACLSCVNACSETFYKEENVLKSCIQVVEKNGVVKPMTCIQCGKCEQHCPQHISIREKLSAADVPVIIFIKKR